ncbi:hypothetical protein DICVIV_05035 [Dictyocaulus viviparus]|uniref:Uncharacterized protein n=1 Tax=Dictyocaulus viviparus TaxID=29172 RepID=A0A0D8XWG7_DICVI|nr:hypothetical protein DICVIV_05035 [Dictyocaulus viviparus]
MDSLPETLLIVLAVAMCAILFCFAIGVLMIFHCYDIKDINIYDLPSVVLEKTRHSMNDSQNSIVSSDSESEGVDKDNGFLKPFRAQFQKSSSISV